MSARFVKFTHADTGSPLWVRSVAVVAVAQPVLDNGRPGSGCELMMAGTDAGLHVTDEPDLAVQRIQIAEVAS